MVVTREDPARAGELEPARFGLEQTRWRLRVFNTVEAFTSDGEAMLDAHGFFTAESAARHFLARLSPEWNNITKFVILIEREESDEKESSI